MRISTAKIFVWFRGSLLSGTLPPPTCCLRSAPALELAIHPCLGGGSGMGIRFTLPPTHH